MTEILEKLRLESPKKRRRDSRLILFCKGLKGAATIPTDLIPPIRHCRIHLSLTFQTPITRTDIYKGSFFPQTIRDWNALPDLIISCAECAEDSMARFTSGES